MVVIGYKGEGKSLVAQREGEYFAEETEEKKEKKIYMVFIVLGCTILNNTTQFDCSMRNNATN